jgi:hypothetical protein
MRVGDADGSHSSMSMSFCFLLNSPTIAPFCDAMRICPASKCGRHFFGSNGHTSRPALPVTEAYLKRAPLSRITAKTIANPRLIREVDVHQSSYWRGRGLDTERRIVVTGREPVLDTLRINHYWSRSLEDLRTKIARGDPSTLQPREPVWHFEFEKTLNSEADDTIVPIARRIRALGKGPA